MKNDTCVHADSAEDNIAYAALLVEAKGDGR